MKNNNWVITIIIAILVGAAAFYGGIQYEKTQTASTFRGQFFQNGQGQGGRMGGPGNMNRMRSGGAVIGEVVGQDSNSITVKLQDGSSKIVNITGSTTFAKSETGSKSDIQNGTRISAFGAANSDGSINAQNVQINPPAGMRGGFGGEPKPSGTEPTK